MIKKSLRPIQTAPVQRENTTTTNGQNNAGVNAAIMIYPSPFAGDDAE